jgi:ribosomal protein S6--L-glutamate ligase
MTPRKAIAFETRLRGCRNVLTLGVRTNFSDYTPEETRLIRHADKIYYPTTFYAELFQIMGTETFPCYHTYACAQDKIKQSVLFDWFDIPHPRTRVFYGNRQKSTIRDHFNFPFVAKMPRGSALGKGVFLIEDNGDLDAYLSEFSPAYIQEYLPIDRDIRVVVIGRKAVHAYWRKAPEGDFRCNVAVGGEICLDPVPVDAIDLAIFTARRCRWDDVGIDICCHRGKYYVLEANMKYGREGFKRAGIDYLRLMEGLIDNGEI